MHRESFEEDCDSKEIWRVPESFSESCSFWKRAEGFWTRTDEFGGGSQSSETLRRV